MNVALRRAMTVAEFLDWKEGQEDRWEFDGFEPTAMVGGTAAHSTLSRNVGAGLRQRLRGTSYRAFVENPKVQTVAGIRYADAFVACGPQPGTAAVAVLRMPEVGVALPLAGLCEGVLG